MFAEQSGRPANDAQQAHRADASVLRLLIGALGVMQEPEETHLCSANQSAQDEMKCWRVQLKNDATSQN